MMRVLASCADAPWEQTDYDDLFGKEVRETVKREIDDRDEEFEDWFFGEGFDLDEFGDKDNAEILDIVAARQDIRDLYCEYRYDALIAGFRDSMDDYDED